MINRLNNVATQQSFFSIIGQPTFQSALLHPISAPVQTVLSKIQQAQDVSILFRQDYLTIHFTLGDTRYIFESVPPVHDSPYKGSDNLIFQKIRAREKPDVHVLSKHEIIEFHHKAFPTLFNRVAVEYGLGNQCNLTRLLNDLAQKTASKTIAWQADPKIDNFLLRSMYTTLPDGTRIILEDAYNPSHHALVLQRPHGIAQTFTLRRKSELNAFGLLQDFFNLDVQYAHLANHRAQCDAEETRLKKAESTLIEQMRALPKS